jgi:hypothetical protein
MCGVRLKLGMTIPSTEIEMHPLAESMLVGGRRILKLKIPRFGSFNLPTIMYGELSAQYGLPRRIRVAEKDPARIPLDGFFNGISLWGRLCVCV